MSIGSKKAHHKNAPSMGIFVVRGTTVHVDGFCGTSYNIVRGYDHESRLLHSRYTFMWAIMATFGIEPSHMLVKGDIGEPEQRSKKLKPFRILMKSSNFRATIKCPA